MYVLPALVLGFIICFPVLKGLYAALFSGDLGINLKPTPTGSAVV
jgi:hypothetical protein